MAKGLRVRLSSKGRQRQRLAKGQSSASNPKTSRHRDAARSARSVQTAPMVAVDDNPSIGANPAITDYLPMDALKIRDDREHSDDATNSIFSDAYSQFTAFTGCSNPTFDVVHRNWRSGSKLQNDVLAVLTSVSNVIKEMNGNETDIEYFAALLSTLKKTQSDQSSHIAATSYLIILTLKKLNKEIVRKCFDEAVEILHDKLLEQISIDEPYALKYLIEALGGVLRCQPASIWKCNRTRVLLTTIASFAVHGKPWVRTMTRRVMRSILNDPITSQDDGVHPAASVVGKYFITQLSSVKDEESILSIRILCMIEGILHKMPQYTFNRLIDMILEILSSAENSLKCSALQCIYRTVQRQPPEAVLPTIANFQLVSALLELMPPLTDTNVIAYWMQALCEAHVCLATKDLDECYQLLPKTLEIFISMFDQSEECLAEVAGNFTVRLIERCIEKKTEIVSDSIDLLIKALNIQNVIVWKHILKTQRRIFEFCGQAISETSLDNALKVFADMREDDECFCKGEIDLVIGSIVRYAGADVVLKSIPLNINPDLINDCLQFKRSWLLPVLRENITSAKLSLFIHDLLPLSVQLYKKIPSLSSVPATIFITIEHQIWELLPSFISSCVDLEESFPEIARILGAALVQRPDIRLIILSSLRNILCTASHPDASPSKPDLMRKYAQNYLEILFPLYISKDENASKVNYDLNVARLSSLETIRLYISFASEELIVRYVNEAIRNINSANHANRDKVRLLDLLAAFVRCANLDCINAIFNVIKIWFNTKEIALQKKAYRVLEEIYKRQADPNVSPFFTGNAEDLLAISQQDINTVWKSSRAAMISILQCKMNGIRDLKELMDFTEMSLDRIIVCMDKVNGVHARTNAMKCFVGLCTRLTELGSENDMSIITMLSPILKALTVIINNGSTSNSEDKLRSAFVALNAFAQKFHKILDGSHLNRILHIACDFVDEQRSSLRVLVLRLLRILCQKLPDYVLLQYKELLLNSILEKQKKIDLTHKVRKANRLLLEVLVVRFSSDVLAKSTNREEWRKQLKAIEKKKRRDGRTNKSINDTFSVDDDDDAISSASARTADADTILGKLCDTDEDSDNKSLENASLAWSKASSVWLKDDEEDPTDLLDTKSMVGKITTKKPTDGQKKKRVTFASNSGNDEGIKLTKDGRLIIDNLDLSSMNDRKRKSKKSLEDEMISDGKKQKLSGNKNDEDSEDDDIEDEDNETKLNTWKFGGKGIHRDLSRNFTKNRPTRGVKRMKKGDVRKKGAKYEPYLYVPLNRNKRKNVSA